MIDSKGHMLHVDFGFLLSNSPGNLNFEAFTFKLTNEYMEVCFQVLGGRNSRAFNKFKSTKDSPAI